MSINITCEDNMDLMARYDDNYFDLAIVDPPYGIKADIEQNKSGIAGTKAKLKDIKEKLQGDYKQPLLNKSGKGWKEYKKSNWDSEIPKKKYFNELFRVSKKQIIWGGNYFNYLWSFSNSFIVWNKMQREFSLADGELAWFSIPNKAMRIFDLSRGGALANNNKNGGRIHPTQKPVKLYEWLLTNYAKKNDKVLDTHLGSGSIALACYNLGYELTACEIDKSYFNDCMERLELHQKQLKLF